MKKFEVIGICILCTLFIFLCLLSIAVTVDAEFRVHEYAVGQQVTYCRFPSERTVLVQFDEAKNLVTAREFNAEHRLLASVTPTIDKSHPTEFYESVSVYKQTDQNHSEIRLRGYGPYFWCDENK